MTCTLNSIIDCITTILTLIVELCKNKLKDKKYMNHIFMNL